MRWPKRRRKMAQERTQINFGLTVKQKAIAQLITKASGMSYSELFGMMLGEINTKVINRNFGIRHEVEREVKYAVGKTIRTVTENVRKTQAAPKTPLTDERTIRRTLLEMGYLTEDQQAKRKQTEGFRGLRPPQKMSTEEIEALRMPKDVQHGYRKSSHLYPMSRIHPSARVTIPKEIIYREAWSRGLDAAEFIGRYQVDWIYGQFEGVLLIFSERE